MEVVVKYSRQSHASGARAAAGRALGPASRLASKCLYSPRHTQFLQERRRQGRIMTVLILVAALC
jgi:hypothetical protein